VGIALADLQAGIVYIALVVPQVGIVGIALAVPQVGIVEMELAAHQVCTVVLVKAWAAAADTEVVRVVDTVVVDNSIADYRYQVGIAVTCFPYPFI
jgi:hypothetical protein